MLHLYLLLEYFRLVIRRIYSEVAQWKRAGLITQRSMDRNHSSLLFS
jgi:hypothetical protein